MLSQRIGNYENELGCIEIKLYYETEELGGWKMD